MGFDIPLPNEQEDGNLEAPQATSVMFDSSGLVVITGVNNLQIALELVDAALSARQTTDVANTAYAPAFSGASITIAGTQSVSATTEETVEFNTLVYEVGSADWWDAGAPFRLTNPYPFSIYARIESGFHFSSIADQKQVYMFVRKNGTTQIGNIATLRSSASSSLGCSGTCTVILADNDYLELQVHNGDASARNLNGTPNTFLSVQYLGSV